GVAPELSTGTLWQHCPPHSSVSLRLWGLWSLTRRSSRAPPAQKLRSRSLSILLHGRQNLTGCRHSTPLPRKSSCKQVMLLVLAQRLHEREILAATMAFSNSCVNA